MLRKLLFTILIFAGTQVTAQKRKTIEIFKQKAFNPEYSWQSKLIFDFTDWIFQ